MSKSTLNTQKHNGNMSSQPEILISHDWFSEALMSKDDAVIATDKNGAITDMNGHAEELTGWSFSESRGKPIDSIFDAINEHTHLAIENPINRALKQNKVTL